MGTIGWSAGLAASWLATWTACRPVGDEAEAAETCPDPQRAHSTTAARAPSEVLPMTPQTRWISDRPDAPAPPRVTATVRSGTSRRHLTKGVDDARAATADELLSDRHAHQRHRLIGVLDGGRPLRHVEVGEHLR